MNSSISLAHFFSMRDYQRENLTHDPIHGYIPFTSNVGLEQGETSERQIIDHPWIQRLRQIRQLQTAHWVFPTAEHTRFQHVIGVMHLASRLVGALYESLRKHCPDAPSRGYVESLMRMAGLLHDVGHGPFGHFFDAYFLSDYRLTHETLGAQIIREELGDMLRGIRRSPNSQLERGEQIDPDEVAWLVVRPQADEPQRPRWLRFLRSLLSGVYTIDNLDFVLRDAYMTGYSQRSYDLDRLLHYSFFSDAGLTIHERGVEALVRFMGARAELFRTIYFHRTVRAIDLALADLFEQSKSLLFPGDPSKNLPSYQQFTDMSLLVDVSRWHESDEPQKRELAPQWRRLLQRQIPWEMVCQRSLVYAEGDRESSSVFNDRDIVASLIRRKLPPPAQETPLRVDIARHIHRPHTQGFASGQNFLYDAAQDKVRPLTGNELFKRLPISHRICRVYAHDDAHAAEITAALDALAGGSIEDDLTNM